MSQESGSIVANVKVTHDTPDDLEAGNGSSEALNPLQAFQQHSAKFHQEKVRPLLGNLGTSFKQAGDAMGTSFKQAGDATVAKSREIGDFTVTKSREIGIGTTMAAAATVAHTKHTLSQIGSDPTETTADGQVVVKGEENDFLVEGGNVFKAHGIQALAAGGGVAALITMILLQGQLIDIACLATVVLAPLVVYQKMQLNELGGMRAQQNALRHSVNRLTTENGKLSDANTQLEAKVDSLKDVENQLNDIAIEAGSQVDRLVNCVAQNGQLQKQIKESLENQVAQSIMTAILSVDQDGSFTLDQREVMKLELKLENLPAVHFDQKNFENFLKVSNQKEDLSLTDLANLVKNLKDDTIPNEQKIFSFEPTDILKEPIPTSP